MQLHRTNLQSVSECHIEWFWSPGRISSQQKWKEWGLIVSCANIQPAANSTWRRTSPWTIRTSSACSQTRSRWRNLGTTNVKASGANFVTRCWTIQLNSTTIWSECTASWWDTKKSRRRQKANSQPRQRETTGQRVKFAAKPFPTATILLGTSTQFTARRQLHPVASVAKCWAAPRHWSFTYKKSILVKKNFLAISATRALPLSIVWPPTSRSINQPEFAWVVTSVANHWAVPQHSSLIFKRSTPTSGTSDASSASRASLFVSVWRATSNDSTNEKRPRKRAATF